MVTPSSPTSAVSPITIPVAWSMNTREPITAPGWISHSCELTNHFGEEPGYQFSVALPQPMGPALAPDCVDARIAESHLKSAAGRGIRS